MSEIVKGGTLLPSTEFAEDLGGAAEERYSDEVKVPFLALLQDQSGAITGAKGVQTVQGAKPGLLLESVTNILLGKEALFVPAFKDRSYVEWKTNRGGFVGRRRREDPDAIRAVAESKRPLGPFRIGENELVDTFYLYGALVGDESGPFDVTNYRPIVLAFSSTKVAVFTAYNTKFNYFMAPTADGGKRKTARYEHLVRIRTARQSNAKGSFFNFVLEPAIDGDMRASLLGAGDPRLQYARELCQMVKSGVAKAVEEDAGEAEAENDAQSAY